MLRDFAAAHPASSHPLFSALDKSRDSLSLNLSQLQAGALLRNYDAHASHLRRLLLKAATIMPECAVGYILENVRNEYGNGNPDDRHQLQLQDLAWQVGLSREQYDGFAIASGIKTFIDGVTAYYYPVNTNQKNNLPEDLDYLRDDSIDGFLDVSFCKRAAVAAGAITATELLAVEEFKSLQKAFTPFGLAGHIWFDHVAIECEHFEDSVNLALYFLDLKEKQGLDFEADVLLGLKGVLDANIHLYDGLLSTFIQD
jgi:hypothetical protein